MSSGNCENYSVGTDVTEIVRVIEVSVATEINVSGNLDEEPGVLDVLDSFKQDRFV